MRAARVPGSGATAGLIQSLRPRGPRVLSFGSISATTFPLSIGLLVATLGAAIAAGWYFWDRVVTDLQGERLFGDVAYLAVTAFVTLSFMSANLAYQLSRLGQIMRSRTPYSDPNESLEVIYGRERDSLLTVLIPTYKENLRLLHQTLLATALQEYPNRRVVLLIDDPPYPRNPEDLNSLVAARRLPRQVQSLLDAESEWTNAAYVAFLERKKRGVADPVEEIRRLSALFRKVSTWYLKQAATYPAQDHTDKLFLQRVFLDPGHAHLRHGNELVERCEHGRALGIEDVHREYRRLVSVFGVELSSFERKRFVNLTHEQNKAANINSYISLLGKRFRHKVQEDGICLLEAASHDSDFEVYDTKYVMIVDADSIIVRDYAQRLIAILERPGNERLAIAQTPYVAVPGAPGLMERIAGATTDVQYLMHQGYTAYGATFWVGANAVARKEALDEICVDATERGYPIRRYIQDRTHIEDTESSIDLVERGWQLHNYPDRLAYSPTPADFGALLIQRRRWANGGLIIAPKTLGILFSNATRLSRLAQVFVRLSYLVGLALGSLAMLISLIYPFDESLLGFALVVGGVAYLSAYVWDLVRQGYKATDFFHVYSLNLLLVPINLAGAYKSLHQACTGKKTPFQRTPKIDGRTSLPLSYLLAEYAILALCVYSCFVGLSHDRLIQTLWAGGNALAMTNGIANLVFEKASAVPERMLS